MNTFNINIDKFITYYKISTYSTFMGSIITAFLIIQSFKFGLIFFLFLTAQLFFVQKYCEKNILELIESKLKMMNLEIRTSKFYFASVWNFYFISLTESQEIFLFYQFDDNPFSSATRYEGIVFEISELEKVHKYTSKAKETKLNKKTVAKNAMAGGLMFGTKGALIGSALTKDKTTRTYDTGWFIYISFKNSSKSYDLTFKLGGLLSEKKYTDSQIDKWYQILKGEHKYFSKKRSIS